MDVFDDEGDDGAAAQTSSLKTWKPLVLENGTQELLWMVDVETRELMEWYS